MNQWCSFAFLTHDLRPRTASVHPQTESVPMKLNITAELDYGMEQETDILMQIECAALPDQRILSETLDTGRTGAASRIAAEDGVGTRVWLTCHGGLRVRYTTEIEIDRAAPDLRTLSAEPVHRLPHEAVRYLMASRYCQSDEFQSFVNADFGHVAGGAAVHEMAEWIRTRFAYVSGSSGPTTTAIGTFVERRGICRDFAHVLIALARAKAIPARMVSCYGPDVTPPDFHAVVQVWLDGGWHLVDPTGMSRPDRVAIIGVGRDAADIAFLTSYGWVNLQHQAVYVRET
ncbi:transglutaminase family protein [Palleronia rufa]